MSETGLPKLGSTLYQAFIEFPGSALTIPRQQDPSVAAMPSTITSGESKAAIDESLYRLCLSSDTVSSILAKDPTLAPGEAWKKLVGSHVKLPHESPDARELGKGNVSSDEIKKAQACGKWGNTEPSELFLRVSLFALNLIKLAYANYCEAIPRCALYAK
jgi:hypothetical protein